MTLMYQHNFGLDTETQRNREKFKHIGHPNPKEKQGTSPAELPILLWRDIPMSWGTTIDILTPEINPFQYAREIKYITLKDQNSYLIPDG